MFYDNEFNDNANETNKDENNHNNYDDHDHNDYDINNIENKHRNAGNYLNNFCGFNFFKSLIWFFKKVKNE